jgi:hypothetical protein
MPYQVFHFREADRLLQEKNLDRDFEATMTYLDDVLYGTLYRRELLREALQDMGWRDNGSLNFLEGRRYQFKGFKKGIGLEANFNFYEYLLEGLFRLQIGFDKGLIESGILLLTAKRSEKSPYGSSAQMLTQDVELLYPTIYLPLTAVLFDLGEPRFMEDAEISKVFPGPQMDKEAVV